MKKLSVLFAIILVCTSAFATIMPEVVYYADRTALTNMCSIRGLSTEGTNEELQARIYEYEGLEYYEVEEADPEEGEENDYYILEVLNADSLVEEEGTITLTGAVKIGITTEDSPKKILSASRIIVDSDLSKVTALGNAVYSDSDPDAALQEISADIFTILWEKGDLCISGGTTSTERKNVEDEKISFYTTGETLTYLEEGAIVYDEGYITSNPKHAYSSISANKLLLLPGQDMFLTRATFNIGRVPVLYLPAFVFPGSKIIGNPNFGFSSVKGAFVNTTFEIFGKYSKFKEQDDSSSFTAILKSEDGNEQAIPVGYYYGDGELSSFENWARETNSYLVLMADAYQGNQDGSKTLPDGGIHFGFDSNINLLSNKLKISAFNGIALSSPVYKGQSNLRYYGENSISYDDAGLHLAVRLPLYSDSLVLKDFGNRLSGFSFEPLLGNESEFPSDYSSSITSFKRSLTASYSLPSKYTGKLISSLTLSDLTISADYSQNKKTQSSFGAYDFSLNSMVLPSLNAKVSGSLLSLNSNRRKKTEVSKSEEKTEEEMEDSKENIEEAEVREKQEETLHPLENVLLMDLYQIKSASSTSSTVAQKGDYSLSLDYNITENLNNTQDYAENEKTSDSLSSTTSAKVSLTAKISDYLTITNNYVPSITTTRKNTLSSSLSTLRDENKVNMTDSFTVSSSKIGLSYELGLKLYSLNETTDITSTGDKTTKSEEKIFVWEKDYITTHKLTFSKSLKTDIGSFTGSVSYTIPPLTGTLQPSLSWSKGKYNASINWKLVESDEKKFESDLVTLTGKYSGKYVSFSDTAKYQTKNFSEEEFLLPFSNTATLNLKDKTGKYSFTQYVDYMYYSENYENRNIFNSIKSTFVANILKGNVIYKTNAEGEVKFASFDASCSLKTSHVQFWKGRVYVGFSLNTSLVYNKEDIYRSTFSMTPVIQFSIAEFIDINLSFTTQNNRLSNYFVNDHFSLDLMYADLKRSVDFIGDGRRNTNFIMKNMAIEFVHYMEDWDLNCKYSTELVKSEKIYTLQPSLTLYLSWKTMPDLKAEEKWKQVRKTDGTMEWQQY